jgi:glycosyltransferase involved in cell wall biosynthesis
LAHSWIAETAVRRHAQFVLAIGGNGPRWFRAAGYRSEKIFPFAYFLPFKSDRSQRDLNGGNRTTVSYIGRFTKQKGVHIFLDAVEKTKSEIQVEIAGAGSEVAAVSRAVATSRIPMMQGGAIPMSEVPRFFARSDILVVPSITTNDGWAAVVSEALMAGVAVIASRFVGASICLADPLRGVVVSSVTGETVARAIDGLVDAGVLSNEHRSRRARWASARLSDAAGERYLIAILSYVAGWAPRPEPFYLDSAVGNSRLGLHSEID